MKALHNFNVEKDKKNNSTLKQEEKARQIILDSTLDKKEFPNLDLRNSQKKNGFKCELCIHDNFFCDKSALNEHYRRSIKISLMNANIVKNYFFQSFVMKKMYL